MEICSIGFTGRTAEEFFAALKKAGIRRLIDVRLNNTSQLAAFTKKVDLRYFLREILDSDYVHEPLLAPTQKLLSSYRKKSLSWEDYEHQFIALLSERRVEQVLNRDLFLPKSVLLCSEHKPSRCHRRLVIDYLAEHWHDVTPIHL